MQDSRLAAVQNPVPDALGPELELLAVLPEMHWGVHQVEHQVGPAAEHQRGHPLEHPVGHSVAHLVELLAVHRAVHLVVQSVAPPWGHLGAHQGERQPSRPTGQQQQAHREDRRVGADRRRAGITPHLGGRLVHAVPASLRPRQPLCLRRGRRLRAEPYLESSTRGEPCPSRVRRDPPAPPVKGGK